MSHETGSGLAETLAALENAVWSRRKVGVNRSGKPLPKPIDGKGWNWFC